MSAHPLHLIDLLGIERDWVLKLFNDADRLRAARVSATCPALPP